HRPRNVLEVLLAHIVERDFEFSLCVFLHPAGNADSARVRKRLQTCHYIHAITPEITVLNDKFAKVDAYAEFDPLILRRVRIVFGHAALYLYGAEYRVAYPRKLCQYLVSDNPSYPTAMLFYLGLDDGAPKRLPLLEGAFLVRLDEPTVPSDIRRQNSSEPSLDALAGQALILFVEHHYPG